MDTHDQPVAVKPAGLQRNGKKSGHYSPGTEAPADDLKLNGHGHVTNGNGSKHKKAYRLPTAKDYAVEYQTLKKLKDELLSGGAGKFALIYGGTAETVDSLDDGVRRIRFLSVSPFLLLPITETDIAEHLAAIA